MGRAVALVCEDHMITKLDYRFLELAWVISQWSKDPSTRVGAVIVDSDRRIVSTGFNGAAQGLTDDVSSMPRERRLLRTIHAEENALLFSHRSVQSCVIYVTHMPCAKCCSKLIQAGIVRIVVPVQSTEFLERWEDDISETRCMVNECGIQLDVLGEE